MPNLFGLPTPQEIERQRYADAVQLYSNAAPGVALGVRAGQSATGLIGGLLGSQDAETERAKRAEELAQELMRDGVSPGNPEGIAEAARRARQRGLFDLAGVLEQQGAEISKQYLEQEKLQLGNKRLRQQIAEEDRLIAEQGSLTGGDRILSRLGGLPGSTADLENARAVALAKIEQMGIEPTLEMVAAAGRAVHAAMLAQYRTTTDRETFGGRVSTTSAPLSDDVAANAVLAGLGQLPGFRVDTEATRGGNQFAMDIMPSRGMRQGAQYSSGGAQPYAYDGSGQAPRPVNTTRRREPSDLDLDTATEIGNRAQGRVTISATRTPAQIMAQDGVSEDFVKKQQEDSRVQITAIKKLIGSQNEIAKIIEENGAAHNNLINSWMYGLQNVVRGSDTWTADAARVVTELGLILGREFGSDEEKLLVKKLNQAVTGMVLVEKERQALGALTGPDVGILNQTIANPVEFLFRQTGPRGFFDLASGLTASALSGAQESVDSAGIRNQSLPAPHPWFRLASRRAEVDDISAQLATDAITPKVAAEQMSRRLGFRVTERGAQMVAAVGPYAARGGMYKGALEAGKAATRFVGDPVESILRSARDAIPLAPEGARVPNAPPAPSDKPMRERIQDHYNWMILRP